MRLVPDLDLVNAGRFGRVMAGFVFPPALRGSLSLEAPGCPRPDALVDLTVGEAEEAVAADAPMRGVRHVESERERQAAAAEHLSMEEKKEPPPPPPGTEEEDQDLAKSRESLAREKRGKRKEEGKRNFL